MIDIAKIKPPPTPDFGDDLVGRIAAFMYENRSTAKFEKRLRVVIRRDNKHTVAARKKVARAWSAMLEKMRNDQNLVSVLEKKGLLAPLNEISAVIAEGYRPIPDDGSPPGEAHILLATWAASEFDLEGNDSGAARTLNAALQRAGLIDSDKTQSIRQALIREKSAQL